MSDTATWSSDNGPTNATETYDGDISERRWPYYILGALAILGGVFALLAPYLASISLTLMVSAVLLVNGVVMTVSAFWYERTKRVVAAFALGILSIFASWAIFAAPLAGTVSITLLIASYFIASGVVRAYWAVTHREARGWGWLLGSGLVSIAFGVYVIVMIEEAALLVPGIMLGIDLVMSGFALIAVGRTKPREVTS